MRIETEPAFLLHMRPYRETSALLELFTRDHGRIGAVARGARALKPRLQRGILCPFQCLSVDFNSRGELALLLSAEIVGFPLSLRGEKLHAGLYVNELIMRLVERHDPHDDLFERYAALLAELPESAHVAWTLRRFERDLLRVLGYGLQLTNEPDNGASIQPDNLYTYEMEHGPRICRPNAHLPKYPGAALLALEADQKPDAAGLFALRQLMRQVIQHRLGGRELDAWRVFIRPLASALPITNADRAAP